MNTLIVLLGLVIAGCDGNVVSVSKLSSWLTSFAPAVLSNSAASPTEQEASTDLAKDQSCPGGYDKYVCAALEHLSGMRSRGGTGPIEYELALRSIYRSPDADTPRVRRIREKVEALLGPEISARVRKDAWDTVRPVEPHVFGPVGGSLTREIVGARNKVDYPNGPLECSDRKMANSGDKDVPECWLVEKRYSADPNDPEVKLRFEPVDDRRLIARITVGANSPAGLYRIDFSDRLDGMVCQFDECRFWIQKMPLPGLPSLAISFDRGRWNKDDLADSELSALEIFKDVMRDEPHCRVQIRGSADSLGVPTDNRRLAGRRALFVRDLILYGIDRLEGGRPPKLSPEERADRAPDWGRIEVISLGEDVHDALGINETPDVSVRIATARFVSDSEEGKACVPVRPVRLPKLSVLERSIVNNIENPR